MKARFFLIIIVISVMWTGLVARKVIPSSQMSLLFSKETVKVSREKVVNYFQSKLFQDKTLDSYYIQILPDDTYYLPSNLIEFRRFLLEDNLNERPCIKERFDCDDFPFTLKVRAIENGFTLGVVAVAEPEKTAEGVTRSSIEEAGLNGHALNILLIWKDGKIKGYFIEPQNDIIIPVSKYSEYNKGRVFYVWF